MEAKSRYQVIGELEAKKRELIAQKSGLKDELATREAKLKAVQRQKEDVLRQLDRQLEDAAEEVKVFTSRMADHQATLDLLIESVNDSLEKFNA